MNSPSYGSSQKTLNSASQSPKAALMAFSYTCLGGAALKTLNFSSCSSILRPSLLLLSPPPKTLSIHSLHHLTPTHKFPPFLTRAVSVPTGQTLDEKETAKPYQWKATIDFKWIRDNKDAVAFNIKSRNSVADLDLVLDLYDRSLNLQKMTGCSTAPRGKKCCC
ncbi:hypothetical protein MKX01_041456 [Papaver californicum]|nr:hypothetical protein MKX01_041456 [Papaver californicum]